MDYSELAYNQDYGCIPNSKMASTIVTIREREVPWDATDKPSVSSWSSFENFLKEMPDQKKNWWECVNPSDLFTPSQSYRPCCSGFALANAATCAVISQIYNRFSEQKVSKINPFITWIKSKNGSVYGGQSIAAMAIAGNEYGNYLQEDLGDYDPDRIIRTTQRYEDEHAKEHQIGYSLYDGDEPWEAILLTCQKGFSCFVGNSKAVNGVTRDSNGVSVATLYGTWSHATAFAGFQVINGKRYVFWINSHGDTYKTDDGTPDFGCWMSEEVLRSFMSSSFNDLCVVTYCESPYDTKIQPTLNPEAV